MDYKQFLNAYPPLPVVYFPSMGGTDKDAEADAPITTYSASSTSSSALESSTAASGVVESGLSLICGCYSEISWFLKGAVVNGEVVVVPRKLASEKCMVLFIIEWIA